MTAGQAIEMADAMRPNNSFDVQLKQLWLRQVDAALRKSILDRAECGDAFDAVGADVWFEEGLEAETELLVPAAFESLYAHWLCAQIDFALGEANRAANEMQLYSDSVQEFGAWMRRQYPPKETKQFRY